MEMNKEEIGKERMKTKRKGGIKRAVSPTKSKTGSHLVNVPLGNFFNVSTQHSFSALP